MSNDTKTPPKGALAWMAHNSVAANLMMFVILLGGLAGMLSIKQETFPEFTLDFVAIGVPYPGASPREVEQGILLSVEEAVRSVEGVKHVTATAVESGAAITVELINGTDRAQGLNDVKAAIDRITTFPEDAEKPTVSLVQLKKSVMSIAVSGNEEINILHKYAEKVRSDLLAVPGISTVELSGVPPMEMSVEVSKRNLEAFGLTPQIIAAQIRNSSVELPAGEIESSQGEFLLRLSDRKKSVDDFGMITIKSTPNGGAVRLRDVANIHDTYLDNDSEFLLDGKRAVMVEVYRTGDETPIGVSDSTKEYLEKLKAELPEGLHVTLLSDKSDFLRDRIDLLMRNAQSGLILVLLILSLFLSFRLAFWVALGIPISFMGAFLLMPAVDASINMISLFAFIVTLGMVVDDAIVMGENIFNKISNGMDPLEASIEGAKEISVPVFFAIMTTVAAFSPMFFIPGVMGKFFSILPVIVVLVLLFSMLESFFILPAHMAHTHGFMYKLLGYVSDFIAPVYNFVNKYLQRFIKGPYRKFLVIVLHYRYISIATAFSVLVFSIGLVASGFIPWNFMPAINGDVIKVGVTLPFGVSNEFADSIRVQVEAAALKSIEEVNDPTTIRGLLTRKGMGLPTGGGSRMASGTHALSFMLYMESGEGRSYTTEKMMALWEKNLPEMVGIRSLDMNAVSSGPSAGNPVDIQLSHPDAKVLKKVSMELEQTLKTFKEITSVKNTFDEGKPQISFHVLPIAQTLGLTSRDIARQLRSYVYGVESLREQRGRNEIKVVVRLPKDERQSENILNTLWLRTPSGKRVLLKEVVTFERDFSPTSIVHEDGVRIVNVNARLADGYASVQPVIEMLNNEKFPALKEKYPALTTDLVGAAREQQDTIKSLLTNAALAFFVIFALLAIPFKSYIQPFIVMSTIPLGIAGAIIGHKIMGYEMSIISIMGIVALAGVAVNDSLVFVSSINGRRAAGMSAWEACTWSGENRFRPILLTSLTTFFGLMPMIFETSVGARFLIPMAISLGFGVLFATVISLLIVPSLYMVQEDFQNIFLSKKTHNAKAYVGTESLENLATKPVNFTAYNDEKKES